MLVPVRLLLEPTISGVEMEIFEVPGAEPVFSEKPQAINDAQRRPSLRYGEIRIPDSTSTWDPGTTWERSTDRECRRKKLLRRKG
jgi:hypothetical protein